MKSLKLLYMVLVVLAVPSCSTINANIKAKKQNKLFANVIADPVVNDRVFKYNLSFYPVQDPAPIYIHGDTLTIHDTTKIDKVRDSIIHERCNIDMDSLRKANTRTNVKIVVDTLKQKDTSCAPKLALLQKELSNTQGQLSNEKENKEQYRKASAKKSWWIGGLAAAIVLLIVLLIKKK